MAQQSAFGSPPGQPMQGAEMPASSGAERYLAMARARMAAPQQQAASAPMSSGVDMLRSRLAGSAEIAPDTRAGAPMSQGAIPDRQVALPVDGRAPVSAPRLDPDQVATAAAIAKAAGIRPNIPKGQFALGKPGQAKSGTSVHQLSRAEAHPELHAAMEAWYAKNPARRLKGPTAQVIAAASGLSISDAQARGLARRVQQARDELAATKYVWGGAKRALSGRSK